MIKDYADMVGNKYGKLLVLSVNKKFNGKKNITIAACLCDCGENTEATVAHLNSGNRKTCGCSSKTSAKTHGMRNTRVYSIWCDMKKRCTNKKSTSYKWYGAKGIVVCDRWMNSFENFYADMGEAKEGLSIDRIDGNGDYCKSNCKWSTNNEQSRNTSATRFSPDDIPLIRTLSLYGEKVTDIALKFNVSKSAIKHIIYNRTWADIDGRIPV